LPDALDKAHRKGITHRDLKPGNILLTKTGAKLLDFGLAKLKQQATPAASLSQRPTADSAMTAEGTILGTLQYMAPEQVEGKTNEITRTDVFAFAAAVYEMATDQRFLMVNLLGQQHAATQNQRRAELVRGIEAPRADRKMNA
jgi:serine/threonine protein kinase